MRPSIPLAVGILALLSTTAFIVLQVILAAYVPNVASIRVTAIVSVVMQALAVLVLTGFCISEAAEALRKPSRRCSSIIFGVGVVVSTLAAAVSVAALIMLSTTTADIGDAIMGISRMAMLLASSVLLGMAYSCQLIFFVLHFVLGRRSAPKHGQNPFQHPSPPASSNSRLKAIPYNQTNVSIEQPRAASLTGSRSVSPSVGRKSGVETSGSMSSRTRLLPLREKRRPASLESSANRSSIEDTFESWDTSSVDPHNRQTVLEVSSSPPPPPHKARFLETIPASPTGSRSPSPDSSIDLTPPRLGRRRSRSYSPASSRRESLGSLPSTSEAHIHPLFRSDSSDPPPMASPGTSVVASPIAGQVISPRSSIRSLNRMRSGSLPTAPSPLSRQSSFEDGIAKKLMDEHGSIKEIEEEDQEQDDDSSSLRKMTPPIPDWVLSAGNRSSLNGYKRRTLKDGERAPSPLLGSL